MKELVLQPKLVEQVHEAILAEISEGRIAAGERLIQGRIARELGVSRQPVQQALLLLRRQGVLRQAPRRGLVVAPLDPEQVRSLYEVRSVLEGLAFRLAAERAAGRTPDDGARLLERGREAVRDGSVAEMIEADRRFHAYICTLSGNPLIAATLDGQWTPTWRVMGEVLLHDEKPAEVWDQHAQMLAAVAAGQGVTAERLARRHVMRAAACVLRRLGRARGPTGGTVDAGK